MSEFARVKACAKHPVDFWTTHLYYFFSIRLVYLIRNLHVVTPNGLTLTALLLALAGSGCFTVGTRAAITAGLVLAQVSYVFDCADGQLARYRRQFSPIGVWLDMVCDRIKEFAVYFALALGYQRTHPGQWDIWIWAMVAVFALHFLEYYEQIRAKSLARLIERIDGTSRQPHSGGDGNAAASAPAAAVPAWRKRIPFHGFNIGEQYFAMLIFLVFGAVRPLLEFVAVFGVLMCIYRPAVLFWKASRAAARARGSHA
jgi:archaetidylinositol phosphate synthase